MITRKNAYVLAHLGVMATTCNAKANLQDQGQGLISQWQGGTTLKIINQKNWQKTGKSIQVSKRQFDEFDPVVIFI